MEDSVRAHEADRRIVPDTPERRAYVKGLVARGEVARPSPDGSLPPGALYEIVDETPDGLPIVVRRRIAG